MKTIEDYEYYSKHGLVIYIQHSCAIAPEYIDHHIERNLKNLTRILRKKKKYAYFAIIGQIRDTLLFLAIMTKNISFRP